MFKKIYKYIYWLAIIYGLTTCFFLFSDLNVLSGYAVLIIMLLCAISALYFSIKAFKALPGKMNFSYLIFGLFLIIGGTSFDIINTVIHSPSLDKEANQIVCFLFTAGLSVKQIYCISFFYQLAYLALTSILWATFLKAYPIILRAMPERQNFWKRTLFLFSGPGATTFDFIIGKVDYFYFISSITPILTTLSLYRWYLGLEWLDLVPISHLFVPILISITSIFFYVYFSFKYKTIKK